MSILYLSALLLGLGGSVHCFAMCGPLVMGMPFQKVVPSKKLAAVGGFVFAKAIAYGFLGALLGLFGKGFTMLNYQGYLSIMAGFLICLVTFVPAISKYIQWPSILQKKFGKLYMRLLETPKWYYFIGLGFMNGLLPCGLVYTALAAAMASGQAGSGFLFMWLFGIGTVPALVSVVLMKNKISLSLGKYVGKVPMIFSILLGCFLMIRGLRVEHQRSDFHRNGQVISCGH